jgi:ribonuclease BN (tRNA processing enzyme)
VARQIVQAGLRLSALKSIFITHHHSDHNLDYGNLFYFAWYGSARPSELLRAAATGRDDKKIL